MNDGDRTRRLREYYHKNPLMVSSPFGGVDGIDRDLVRNVLEGLGVELTGRAILDVGCGRGYMSEVVRELGGTYVGSDIAVSRRGFRQAVADAHDLPFRDALFDGVFCIDAFEHLAEPVRAALEFHRVLRDDGFVFLSVPNYSNVAGLVKAACERLGRYEKNTWAPFGNWRPQEFEYPVTGRHVRRVFREAGFAGFRRVAHGVEVGLGLIPWMEHPKTPEVVKFRLQDFFAWAGPFLARLWPGASLHGFWRIDV